MSSTSPCCVPDRPLVSETLSRRLGSLPAGPIVNAVIAVIKALRRRRIRRRVLAELYALDSRMLADIGLDRARLDEVAERMARRYVEDDRRQFLDDLLTGRPGERRI